MITRRALADAAFEAAAASGWSAGLHRALRAIFAQTAGEPAMARVALVDALQAGPAALLLTTVRPEPRPGSLAAKGSMAAVWEVAAQHVAEGRPGRLVRLAPALALLLAAAMQGSLPAARAIRDDRRAGRHPRSFATGAAP